LLLPRAFIEKEHGSLNSQPVDIPVPEDHDMQKHRNSNLGPDPFNDIPKSIVVLHILFFPILFFTIKP